MFGFVRPRIAAKLRSFIISFASTQRDELVDVSRCEVLLSAVHTTYGHDPRVYSTEVAFKVDAGAKCV